MDLFEPDKEAPDPFTTDKEARSLTLERPGKLFDSTSSASESFAGAGSESFATAIVVAQVRFVGPAALRAESGESEAARRAVTIADVRAAYDDARWLAAAALIEQLPPREQLSTADAAYLADGVEDDACAAVRVRDALAARADKASAEAAGWCESVDADGISVHYREEVR